MILYEYPFNERIRTYLRLEDLFRRLGELVPRTHALDHHFAIQTIFEVMDVAARADMKTDVLKDLEKHKQQLNSYRGNPAISEASLDQVVGQLETCFSALNSVSGKIGQTLTDNDWLMAIRSRIGIPGGTCEFDLPDYTHWLNQSDEVRGADFAHWLAIIRPLGDAVGELLWMTREQGKSRPEVANGGVFHLQLDRDVPAQMIRIALPGGTDIYPEISGSHYRCSVRFLVWQDANTRPIQTTEDVRFTLTTCT